MTQYIGIDIGRGYSKGFSQIGNETYEVMFKSVIGDGREDKVDYKNYKDPIFIECEGVNYFVGLLAEKESYNAIRNSADSKTSKTVEILLAAILEQIAVKDKVKLMFGVPYKLYTQSVLKKIKEKYKGKTIRIKNKIKGATKNILIEDVDIFREADSSLFWAIQGVPNSKPVGMVNIGFRSTEIAYFGSNFEFNDKLSSTIEFGNSTILQTVSDILLSKNIFKTVMEIDSSSEYDDMKKGAYALASEKVNQMVEEMWINKDEMDLYLSGGTSLHLHPDDKFKRLDDAQMATAKGLFEVAKLQL